jgi:hypothetical protein
MSQETPRAALVGGDSRASWRVAMRDRGEVEPEQDAAARLIETGRTNITDLCVGEP